MKDDTIKNKAESEHPFLAAHYTTSTWGGPVSTVLDQPAGVLSMPTSPLLMDDLLKNQDKAVKYDSEKIPIELIPSEGVEEIAKVMAFGAKKYAAHNWKKGIGYTRLIGAALRHLFAYLRGESKDPESGLSHIAHAGCCIMFILWNEKNRPDLDDRYTTTK